MSTSVLRSSAGEYGNDAELEKESDNKSGCFPFGQVD